MLLQALAPSSRKAYARAWNLYIGFAKSINITASLPILHDHLCLFITFLHRENKPATSISSILSALSYMHKIRNLPDPSISFVVKQLVRAIKKIRSKKTDKRTPISENLLLTIVDKLPFLGLPAYETGTLASMFLLAFYFGLRVGEITNSIHNLASDQIHITPVSVQITFKTHKHSLGQSSPHVISPTKLRHCPVQALNNYVALRPHIKGAFFLIKSKPVSSSYFRKQLNRCLTLAGEAPNSFGTHSFRIGIATHWFNKNLSDSRIRRMGRWSSNAVETYIRGSIDHSTS